MEAKIEGKWERCDPSLHPNGIMLFELLIPKMRPEVDVHLLMGEFMHYSEYAESLRKRGTPIYLSDEPHFEMAVKNAIVAPEMDLPDKYAASVAAFTNASQRLR